MSDDDIPDPFKEGNFGVSGGMCPECGSDNFVRTGNRENEETELVNLQCEDCGQNYDVNSDVLD